MSDLKLKHTQSDLWISYKKIKSCSAALRTSAGVRAESDLPPTVSHKINYDNAFLYPFVIVMNGCLSGPKHTEHRKRQRNTLFFKSLFVWL